MANSSLKVIMNPTSLKNFYLAFHPFLYIYIFSEIKVYLFYKKTHSDKAINY